MTSPTRSVIVRLAMEPSSYIAGASRAAASTTALNREVAKVGATSATSMERAAAGAARAEGAFGKASKTASVFGLRLGELATAGGLVAAALSVKSAADFQQSLTKLATTAGESAKNLGMVGDGLLDMAGKVGISANELAKGMYTVESGGFHGAAGLKVMSAAAQGAVQEQADLSKVTDAVTTILHDYHLSADDAAKVTSQLVTAVSHGKTTFDELTGSLHSVTPLASKMGISLADITGTLSAMTASGESADQATQNMANTLQHLASPTGTMIAELAQLGISTNDLATSLSKRGLAGTLQMVEEAIVHHLDPATQRVLLPALNKSKTAAEDLQIMLGQMPPSLRKLSESFLAGKTALSDYRKSARDLGGQQAAMGTQFMSLVTSSQGFNNEIKAGRPAAQVFTAAMQKAFGTTAALNVALQTTGENAAATNDAIKDISNSAGDAKGNIKGWDEVQGNFNQQMHEAGAKAGALAIQFGQHLLPALTSAFGYINRDVLPAVEHMGSAVGTAAHWWSALPQPIKDVSLALGGLALANKIGLLSALGTAAAKVAAPVRAIGDAMYFAEPHAGRFSAEMEVQQKLFQMEQREAQLAAAGISELDGAFASAALAADGYAGSLTAVQKAQRGWDAALAESMVVEDTQTATLGRMSAATAAAGVTMGRTAAGGMAKLSKAGSGLLALFGGPWGAALIGAAAAVYGINKSFEIADERTAKATQQLFEWLKAQDMGGQAAKDATAGLDKYNRKVEDAQVAYNAAAKAGEGAQAGTEGYAQGVAIASDNLSRLKGELDKAKDKLSTYRASLSPLVTAQLAVKKAQNDFNYALAHNPPESEAVAAAAGKLHDAQRNLASATGAANEAAKTQIERLQEQSDKILGTLDAQRAAQLSQLDLADAIDQYNADAKDGQHSARQLKEEQLGLVDSAEQAAQSAADAAAKQAAQNGATDTGYASQVAFKNALQAAADKMTGPAHDALEGMIKDLGGNTSAADNTASHMEALGLTVEKIPNKHTIEIDAPTDKQMQDLQDLGYETVHLPNGHVAVTADTHPARAEIADLLNYARQQSIVLRASAPDLNGSASGNGRMGTYATGGVVPGYAPGVDRVHALLSPGEGVLVPEAVRGIGGAAGVRAVNSAFSPRVPRFATGGVVIPTSIDRGAISGIEGALAHMSRLYSSLSTFGSGGSGGLRPLGRMIANNMGYGAQFGAIDYIFTHESGWNPMAQNPASTAFGIPQFLNSTWAAYGGRTTDPTMQIRDGIEYMVDRYGSPNNAAAFWAAHHWYHDGGTVQGPAGADIPAVLRVGETVRTAEQEATVQRTLRSREVSGGTYSGGAATATLEAPNVNVQVLIDGQEFRGMAKVVVDGRLEDWNRKVRHR